MVFFYIRKTKKKYKYAKQKSNEIKINQIQLMVSKHDDRQKHRNPMKKWIIYSKK